MEDSIYEGALFSSTLDDMKQDIFSFREIANTLQEGGSPNLAKDVFVFADALKSIANCATPVVEEKIDRQLEINARRMAAFEDE